MYVEGTVVVAVPPMQPMRAQVLSLSGSGIRPAGRRTKIKTRAAAHANEEKVICEKQLGAGGMDRQWAGLLRSQTRFSETQILRTAQRHLREPTV